MHRLLLPILLVLGSLMAVPVQAQPDAEIEQMLRDRDDQIKAILGRSGEPTAAQRERLREVVNEVIDFQAMARTALGPFWRELSAEQRQVFTERFAAVVRAQSLADLDLYRARVSYEGVDVDGQTAVARTVATLNNSRARVDYELRLRDRQWMVTDIVIDGTGTADGYARSFQRVMRRDGVNAGYQRLIDSLQRRLERAS